MNNRVLVLVSTYNGERFLSQQLDSIINQQDVDVSILVRDDGSSDKTMQILEDYASKYQNLQYYQGTNVGPCMSFFDLLKHAEGYDYYAFCDQDDVWDDDKLICALRIIEEQHNNTPVLYCSNLNVVDENMHFYRKAHSCKYNPLNRYAGLIDFYAVGCTEVFNQPAADMVKAHIRNDCLMHDSWMFMICNFFGIVIYDNNAHINYRQHHNNVVGTNKDLYSRLKARIERVADRSVQPRLKNAIIILDEFEDSLSKKDLYMIQKVANYKDSFFNWFRLLFDYNIRSNHWVSDVRYRLLLLMREI